MRRLLKAFLLTAIAGTFAAPASAATLTITDTYGGSNTIWTLNVETGCTAGCDVSLSAFFEDPAGSATNAYTGTYLDSVQWKVGGGDPASVTLTSTDAGTTADWEFDINESLSSNGCSGNGNDAVCGEWVSGGTGDGFGPIVSGSTLNWTFLVDWDSAIPADVASGNIRAAFNTLTGTNFNIFSPNGGTFDTTDTTDNVDVTDVTDNVEITPEPATLVLFGSGLAIAAARLRRRQKG